MIKRTIKETISEYDEDGRLVRQTVTETSEDDDAQYVPYPVPYSTPAEPKPWWLYGPTCNCSNGTEETNAE